jgi:hypothetical protein
MSMKLTRHRKKPLDYFFFKNFFVSNQICSQLLQIAHFGSEFVKKILSIKCLIKTTVRSDKERDEDIQTNGKTDRWIVGGQMNEQTDSWRDRQTDKQMDKQTDRLVDRVREKYMDRKMD